MGKSLDGKLERSDIYQKSNEQKTYSKEEALKSSLEYFKGDKLAAEQWIRKYALKDEKENLYEKNPDQMHRRIASEIVRIENKKGYNNPLEEEKVYNLLKDFRYLVPGGSNMSGIGNNKQIVSLSNCFVVGNNSDSYGGIMNLDQEQVQLMKRRGGVGHDLSHIRPKGSPVKNSALTSTGVVPFMERYSNSTKEVAQDGRRGALMLSISSKHPDAEDFIDAKLEKGKVTNANISVKLDDEFMSAVKMNKSYIQRYPIESEDPKMIKEIDANKLWNKIVHNAWKSAEPGVLFWDTISNESVPDSYADLGFKTVSTNPCGEIPLCPYDSCRLLAINLYSYVENPFTPNAKFNEDLFKEHVHYAQRIMDDIIDLELEKIEVIQRKIDSDPEDEEIKYTERRLWEKLEEKAKKGRRMGIGTTAEGDMTAAMNLTYGTDDSINFSERIHKTLALEAYRSSVELAKERGAFEIYDAEKEKDNPFINRIKEADPELYEEMVKNGRRNIALLTIAPTGTVSIMTQTSSGIEPVFKTHYQRKTKINPNDKDTTIDEIDEEGEKWHYYTVFHHKFENWLIANGKNPKEVKEMENTSEEFRELIKSSPYYKATTEDVDYIKKVELQGKIQKWVDHSISVTINMPEDVSEELVGEAYMKAWESGCKGMTVYREGSRQGIMTSKKKGLEEITLVQNNVKVDKRLEIKPQAIKYKVKREVNKDSLHFIMASNLYVDDAEKKAYFIPDEDFQIRAPLGAATSVSFAQSGMDRTEILRGPNPNYAEIVRRLQSPFSNEDEGMGPWRIRSIEHAAGLVFEDYFLRNGIVGRDENTGDLINLVEKSKLRKVNEIDEYKKIISQVNLGDEDERELSLSGNNGKLDFKFECQECGGSKYKTLEGCDNPVCTKCGWSDPSKSCG
jgi:ribonucleoside-diphosphate reductase alpha chain